MKPLRYKTIVSMGLILITMLSGCKNSIDNSSPQAQLILFQKAQNKWQASNHDYYSFYYKLSCFCDVDSISPKSVNVLNELVLSATNLDSALPVTNEALISLYSIDGLFGLIEQAMNDNAEVIEVEYDSHLGYPVSIAIDYSQSVADDEIYIQTNNLLTKAAYLALTETIWQLNSFITIAGPRPILDDSLLTLKFSRQSLTGNSGCNDYYASYAIEPTSSTILISNISSTELSCENELDQQEAHYLSSLGLVSRYYFSGNELVLFIGNDYLLQFSRSDA